MALGAAKVLLMHSLSKLKGSDAWISDSLKSRMLFAKK
jgi:hypothetical protein